ncbi:nitrate reductase 1 molybdenum cofactor assembly chaperone [Azospirillaceae bacterium]
MNDMIHADISPTDAVKQPFDGADDSLKRAARQKPIRTIKALGVLLTYPDWPAGEVADAVEACLDAECLLPGSTREGVAALLAWLRREDDLTLQEDYVALFDRNRTLSLHLYEHLLGESRDRGQAMVDLIGLYQRNGFMPTERELPDFLPLVCEFLSEIPGEQAQAVLGDAVTVLTALQQRLEQRGSRYAAVFSGLIALSGGKPDAAVLAKLLAGSEDQDSLEALDRVWAEEPVRFDAGSALKGGGCPAVAP